MSEEQNNAQPQVEIYRIYTKDISAESPAAPEIFQQAWEPTISVNLANNSKVLDSEAEIYEVGITITVRAEVKTPEDEEQIAYLIEVEQAGIFSLAGFDDAAKTYVILAMIPSILFPYARETISGLSQKLGFPPLNLNPIDFNQQYLALQQQATQQAGAEAASEENN